MRSTEGPPDAREVDPPQHVWVDLPRLFPMARTHLYRHTPAGLDTRYEAAGLLIGWVRAEDGAWLGLVRYQLLTADRRWQTTVTHYVPQHLFRLRARRRGMR